MKSHGGMKAVIVGATLLCATNASASGEWVQWAKSRWVVFPPDPSQPERVLRAGDHWNIEEVYDDRKACEADLEKISTARTTLLNTPPFSTRAWSFRKDHLTVETQQRSDDGELTVEASEFRCLPVPLRP